eukprot:scaffold258610_cov28-Attheya_sp.AAC.1
MNNRSTCHNINQVNSGTEEKALDVTMVEVVAAVEEILVVEDHIREDTVEVVVVDAVVKENP